VRSFSRLRRIIGLLGIAALAATACGDDSDDGATASEGTTSPASADEVCTEDRVGGTLAVGTYSEAGGLDPVVAAGTGLGTGRVGATEGSAIFDVLVIHDSETGEYTPHLAEALTPNEDNTKWTLKLRPDITFDNGDPLDAQAVVTSMQRHTAQSSRSTLRRGVVLIQQFEVTDPLTVVFHLAEPWGDFPMLLAASPGMITNQRVVDERGADFNRNPNGGGVGPYVVDRFMPGEVLVLKARENYWGGPVCVKELRFVNIVGGPATYEALEAGQLDVAFLPDGATINRARDADYEGLEWIIHSGSMLLMNTGLPGTDPPTSDLRVRQAIAHALDVDYINERQFDGYGLATTSLVHPDSPISPGVDGPEFNRQRATQLITQVKAETGWDGSIRLLCNDPTDRRDAALAIETLLNAVGMQVQRTIGDTSQLIAGVVTNKDYDLACWSQNFTEADVWFNLGVFASNSPTNYSGIQDPAMDAALIDIRAARDSDELRAALGTMQERWNEIVPSAVWGAVETYIAHDDDVHGLVPTVRETFLFHDAYISQ